MALGSAQALAEMNTRAFPWGTGGRCIRLTTLPSSCAVVINLRALASWNPLGHSRPVTGRLYLTFVWRFWRRKEVCGFSTMYIKGWHMKDYPSLFTGPIVSNRDSDVKEYWNENLFNWTRPPGFEFMIAYIRYKRRGRRTKYFCDRYSKTTSEIQLPCQPVVILLTVKTRGGLKVFNVFNSHAE